MADKIVRQIAERCHPLENHPFGGRSRDEIRPGLGAIATRLHVIFYRVLEGRAEIIRVLDGRRDIDEISSPSVVND